MAMPQGPATESASAQPVLDWLIDGARSAATPAAVLDQLCRRLTKAGVPLARAEVFVSTLHPEVVGRRFLWLPGEDVRIAEIDHAAMDTGRWSRSPEAAVVRDGAPVRLCVGDEASPYRERLAELAARGLTDALVCPLAFTTGAVHGAGWATRVPGGFGSEHLRVLQAVSVALARVAEIWAWRRISGTLLDTYVGPYSGQRVLAGQIRRGDVETIDAAIWLSDLRGFTALADRLPPAELVALLNRYFDCQVPAIAAAGGEVLKFIGDGLLAIFPVPSGQNADRVCARALEAVRAACANVAALRHSSAASAYAGLEFGLALHLGAVSYGNIGSAGRLDFTCIGPAVNRAARMAALCREVKRTALASAEFAAHCGAALAPLGEFELRGFAARHAVLAIEPDPLHAHVTPAG